jgi:hypothetical protein
MDREVQEGIGEWRKAKQEEEEEREWARRDNIRQEIEWRMECAFFKLLDHVHDRRP